MNKFYFGMETMRITQNYNGTASHYNHSHGTPVDYPIDCAGVDGRQSAYFAPVDMKVVAIRGVGNYATNTRWLETTETVQTPTFNDIVWLTLTHWNDGSITSKFKVGDVIKAGEIIAYEGTDGATANHLHVTCGRGHCNSWTENTKGSWVMSGTSLPPEDVMYINDDFTKCVDSGGLVFKSMPKDNVNTSNSNENTSGQSNTKTKRVGVTNGLYLMKLDNSAKITLMPHNAIVTVLQENYTTAKGYSMDKVEYNGTVGMCANQYLK